MFLENFAKDETFVPRGTSVLHRGFVNFDISFFKSNDSERVTRFEGVSKSA